MKEKQQLKRDASVLLKNLAEAHGAPGCEKKVREIFREQMGGQVSTDRMGNIFHRRRGKGETPRIMLTAHMDEVGFAVQSITKSGLLRFIPLGGWWSHNLLAQRVRIMNRKGREIPGVIGSKPVHFLSDAEREKVIKVEDMFIDVGARNAEEAEKDLGIDLGDPIVPESPFMTMANPDLLMCKGFDNRVGMALLIQTMSLLSPEKHPNTVHGVATVQEEVGVRGATTAGHSVEPDLAIVLEGTPADDLPGMAEEECQARLGEGVQIRLMDPSAIMNRGLVNKAADVARMHGIPFQKAVRRTGATDAKAIHLHGKGVPTVVLGVPARYIHTHNSIIHLEDYLSGLRLALELIGELDHETVKGFTDFEGERESVGTP